MKDTATIATDALERAGACISKHQAIEAGGFFGGELASEKTDAVRRRGLRVDLAAARAKTAQGSYAREFMDAVLAIVLVEWADTRP